MFEIQNENQIQYKRKEEDRDTERKGAEEGIEKGYSCRLQGTMNVAKVNLFFICRHLEL